MQFIPEGYFLTVQTKQENLTEMVKNSENQSKEKARKKKIDSPQPRKQRLLRNFFRSSAKDTDEEPRVNENNEQVETTHKEKKTKQHRKAKIVPKKDARGYVLLENEMDDGDVPQENRSMFHSFVRLFNHH